METAIIIFHIHKEHRTVDLEVPLDLTAKELAAALNEAYGLGVDLSDMGRCGKRILCGSLYGIKTGIPESGRVDQRDRGSIRLHSQDRGRDRQQHCKSVPWIVRKSRFKGSSG